MNTRAVLHSISFLLLLLAAAMGICGIVSHYYADPTAAQRGLAGSCAAVLLIGALLWVCTRGPIDLSRRDGIGIVTFGWLFTVAAGALPYMISGSIANPVSALFESVSGFTTTGGSVIALPELEPKGILLWRATTHFLGGMGILVLCIAIIPFLGIGGMQIYRAEVSGPSKDRLTPRITSTAKLLWGVYILLNAAETVLLRLGGMSWFDAVCHSFSTLATGGFSTQSISIQAYNSLFIEVVTIVFMLLGAINFSLHFRALRGDFRGYFRDPEFRFYLGFWVVCCAAMTLITWRSVYDDFGPALRNSVFSVTSISTTTGFSTADFDQWPLSAKLLLIGLMIAGGCTGSTCGALKQIRVLVVLKTISRELRLFIQPKAVLRIKIGADRLEPTVVSNISAYFVVYILTLALASLAMTFFMPDLQSAIASVAASLGGVGPGLGVVGPLQNYAAVPAAGKIILIVCMLLGRLEFYTLLALIMPRFWKK